MKREQISSGCGLRQETSSPENLIKFIEETYVRERALNIRVHARDVQALHQHESPKQRGVINITTQPKAQISLTHFLVSLPPQNLNSIMSQPSQTPLKDHCVATHIAQNIAETCQKYFQSFIAIELLSQYFIKHCKIFH